MLSFESGSFARPRELTIRDEQDHVIYRNTIGGEKTKIRIPLRFSNRTDLSVSTNPPPDQINLMIGGYDTRRFGVFIGRVRFTPN
jgi:hypothetical protein